ncbi:hypothetical protein [Nocardioides lijunqiniae]|uniref:hypothetical protein n=1 Tax=Nocardioides lijunqiniae TaxID=2760832 RepID=UPI00187877B6|nr:hypothetical protein [Nocardioides lijunqiniae]
MLTSLRLTVGAMMTFLLLMALALSFVLAPGSDPQPGEGLLDAPQPWVLAAIAAAGVALHVLITLVGYRTPAIAPGTPADVAGGTSAAAMSSGTVLRAALSESVALASIALAFIVSEGSYLTYVVGAAVSLALFVVHAYPGERTIARTEASLEREGGRSHLRDRLLLPAPRPGAIQEL